MQSVGEGPHCLKESTASYLGQYLCKPVEQAEHEKRESEEFQSLRKNTDTSIKVKRNYTADNDRGPKAVTPRKKVRKAGRAWSVLCAGHHNNRIRACDTHGCGAFNSKRVNGLHKAVDLVCDDYGIINAPFSGSLAGPVSQKDPAGNHYDGVKLLSDVHCVKIFNIRPYRYLGPVAQGEALGYLLPLQEHFSGITSHLELQMCDGTDPSPFI
ncbi:leukocyte cell-derived chemotaxin-2 [Stegastes partitus]|uniref:Leukocyte cell-derived chemotaxin-2 n=1 Tax=Stegastes partitus TaxID=144197 RepID=A0A9Y4NG51_9TELE|nr:PREDICTED: leukocyte cell-derived chemotaxin-2-like [Stegastes partitus]